MAESFISCSSFARMVAAPSASIRGSSDSLLGVHSCGSKPWAVIISHHPRGDDDELHLLSCAGTGERNGRPLGGAWLVCVDRSEHRLRSPFNVANAPYGEAINLEIDMDSVVLSCTAVLLLLPFD